MRRATTRRATLAVVAGLLVALAGGCGGAAGGDDVRSTGNGSMPDGFVGGVFFGDGGARPADGRAADTATAPVDQVQGETIRVECAENGDCPPQWPVCDPSRGRCVECLAPADCASGRCEDDRCAPVVETCSPAGGRLCEGDRIVVCSAAGAVSERIDCQPNVCLDGQCALCRPGETSCQEGAVVRCNEGATGVTVLEQCATDCFDGRCVVCHPNAGRCEEGRAERCSSDGSTWELVQDCDAYAFDCVQGVCVNPCASDPKTQTNAGCDFWALDLDNANVTLDGNVYDAQHAQFAVIVSNTSSEREAQVTLTLPDDSTIVRSVSTRALETFLLPSTWSLDGTSRTRNGFRVESNRPVTVYQFNPLANVDVFSNDASVLLPTPSLGNEYYVATLPAGNPFRGYFTVVAVEPGTTELTVRPTAATEAGPGIPAMIRGVDHGVTMQRGDVLNVETPVAGGDLSGTWILASQRVVVFSGHEAAGTGGRCCADHLEQQLLPTSRWGTRYVASRSQRRSLEKDHWMILSSAEGNPVRIEPASAGSVPATLDPGEPAYFVSDQDFVVTADEPILLVQYLASSFEILAQYDQASCISAASCHPGYTCAGVCRAPSCNQTADCPSGHTCKDYGVCEPIGDPAMILSVPTEQFRKEYVFLTPNSYLEDYANVIAPLGSTVTLDGRSLDAARATPVSQSGFVVYRQLVTDGVHTLSADQPIGLVVYGYDDDVSYGYPGGMGLENLRE